MKMNSFNSRIGHVYRHQHTDQFISEERNSKRNLSELDQAGKKSKSFYSKYKESKSQVQSRNDGRGADKT
jgi:hypothetical protein